MVDKAQPASAAGCSSCSSCGPPSQQDSDRSSQLSQDSPLERTINEVLKTWSVPLDEPSTSATDLIISVRGIFRAHVVAVGSPNLRLVDRHYVQEIGQALANHNAQALKVGVV